MKPGRQTTNKSKPIRLLQLCCWRTFVGDCAQPSELLFLTVPPGPRREQPAGQTLSLLMFLPIILGLWPTGLKVSDRLKCCLLAVHWFSYFFMSPAEGFRFKSTNSADWLDFKGYTSLLPYLENVKILRIWYTKPTCPHFTGGYFTGFSPFT